MGTLTISHAQLAQLNQFANSAYGVKGGSGKSGGLGILLMDSGRVVKARTRWFQQCTSLSNHPTFVASTQALRLKLGEIISGIRDAEANRGMPQATKEALTKILADLGLDKTGRKILQAYAKKLLSRKTVAKALNKLDVLTGADKPGDAARSVWGRAAETATSIGEYPKTFDENGALKDNGTYEFDLSEDDWSGQHTKTTTDYNDYVTGRETLVDTLADVADKARLQDEAEVFEKRMAPQIMAGLGRLRLGGAEKGVLVGTGPGSGALRESIANAMKDVLVDYQARLYSGKERKLRHLPASWQAVWNDAESVRDMEAVLKSHFPDQVDFLRVTGYLKLAMDNVCQEAYKTQDDLRNSPFGQHQGTDATWGLKPGYLSTGHLRTFSEALPDILAKCAERANRNEFLPPYFERKRGDGVSPNAERQDKAKVASPGDAESAAKAGSPAKPAASKPLIAGLEPDEADAIEKELEHRTSFDASWSHAFSAWTLKRFMQTAEQHDVAAAMLTISPQVAREGEAAKLQEGYLRQKDGWQYNQHLWDRLSSEADRLLSAKDPPDLGLVRDRQAAVLRDFLLEAYEASMAKDVPAPGDLKGLQGQGAYDNTCPIVSLTNAMIGSGDADTRNRIADITTPKDLNDGKGPYYEFPHPAGQKTRVYVSSLTDRLYPESTVWKGMPPFQKAVLHAINLNFKSLQLKKEIVPGREFEFTPVAELFGAGTFLTVGRLGGQATTGEFELHAAKVAQALAKGKTCVLGVPGHFSAITGVTFREGSHEPVFTVVESVGGAHAKTVALADLPNGYQLYIQQDGKNE